MTDLTGYIYNAGHGREGTIKTKFTECFLCNDTNECIEIDGSEGEYEVIALCRSCINHLFFDENKDESK